ncbi:MAG: J domain-containing protein [Clostridia bacterium]
MKNYYELLEVSEKASPEVIKKAYITLVKKYHPDLQPDGEKKSAEEKIKEINEAYEVLSDKTKKESYDRKLQMQRVKEEHYNTSSNSQNTSNNTYKNTNSNNKKNNYSKPHPQKRVIHKPTMNENFDDFSDFNNFQNDYNNIMNEVYNNAYNEAYNNAYNQAYINNLKNMGYEIRYERPFKEKLKIAFASFCGILLVIFIGFILWHIPFIKNYFINLYNNNVIFKIIVDLISNIIESFLALFK